ncbi:plasmid replication, integration and excision activator [Xylanimonas protaetiae]|uniref:Plasmid replication, integration and excision activator n=1 Tax=Xylanimonas protaetiae TaxID=2509457 RepID=A0A4P6F8V0_9MICO|nr:plasmid replication, integration and excision activator [Xylanimonas protaetiae]QAY69737.1 plasmid replication, integration and excision activator [Xylanimonas protaetiae]
MAIARRFPIAHAAVFPNGAFLHGVVEPVTDFQVEQRKDGSRPQQRDKETGLPIWQCTVIDGDEDARARNVGVVVKFAAEVIPVPPKNTSGLPWTPVEFVGLTAMPYVDTNGQNPRLAWSFRADGFASPNHAAQPAPSAKPPEPKAAA